MELPGFLDSPEVRRWLGGVEPAWTLLTVDDMMALHQRPSKENRALSIADDLTETEIATSAVARNILIVLRRASEGDGLKLTQAGSLSRAAVTEMVELFEWPSYDRTKAFWMTSAISEPDFLPLLFVRRLAQLANLVRPYRGTLKTTRLGHNMLKVDRQRALLAILFHVTFWSADLSYIGRGIHGSWPQGDIGVTLWSLCIAATHWRTSKQLVRLCTIPVSGILKENLDIGSLIMEARILRPLVWFGLLESRVETTVGVYHSEQCLYRKAPLFDRFLTFDVRTELPEVVRH
jgi:hypothetical protein